MPFLLIYFFTYLIFTPKVFNLHADLGGGAGGGIHLHIASNLFKHALLFILQAYAA